MSVGLEIVPGAGDEEHGSKSEDRDIKLHDWISAILSVCPKKLQVE